MKYLITGLGNIGAEYANTRHNIGFIVIEALAEKLGAKFEIGRHAYVAEASFKGRKLVLIKPTTYMNLSGKAVQHWLSVEKIPIENSLTITDDLALPFGKQRLRTKGSHGGQNGLRNIQEIMGTDTFARLRFGIGNDYPKGKQVDYVLGKFSQDQEIELKLAIDKSIQGILDFCTIGPDKTMTAFNAS